MRRICFGLLLGLATAACHHQPVTQAPAPVGDLTNQTRADSLRKVEAARADSIAMARKAEADRVAREAAERMARTQAALREALAERTYFEFNQSEIRIGDRQLLEKKLAILRANPGLTLRVAGHADERGSDEYNLALGARRAAVVRAYLVNHGVAQNRIDVVSYGEERPLVQGDDERAWAQNRRDEFTPTAGADTLIAPAEVRGSD